MSIQLTIQETIEIIHLQVDESNEAVSITVTEAPETISLSIVEGGTVVVEGEQAVISLPAAAIMSSGAPVVLTNGQAVPFNPANPDHAGAIVGFAQHSSSVSQPLAIRTAGLMQNDGYSLTAGSVVFATANGVTNTPPTAGVAAVVGQAITPTSFVINFFTPIILS